jgi:hypothetical protein
VELPGRHYPARRDARNRGAARTGREIGLTGYRLLPAGTDCGIWDGRVDRVHFFELWLEQLPELRLDNREIIGARLVSAAELRGMALTGPVTAYLGRMPPPGGAPSGDQP